MEIKEELSEIEARKEETKRREKKREKEDEAQRILEGGLTMEEKWSVFRNIVAQIKAGPTEPERLVVSRNMRLI